MLCYHEASDSFRSFKLVVGTEYDELAKVDDLVANASYYTTQTRLLLSKKLIGQRRQSYHLLPKKS